MKKNGELKIEKGVPFPSTGRGTEGPVTAALAKMEVGDSVLVPDKALNRVSGSVQYFCGMKSYGDRFKLRTVEGGVRIWRIA